MKLALISILIAAACPAAERLPFSTVFKGQDRFDQIVAKASPQAATLRAMPIGERVAWFGQMLVGTPYKGFTLEIDDHVEAPSVNLTGLDCWTFFETALAFARMSSFTPDKWSPQQLLAFIEQDRYWSGKCDGSYLSRLHYLEDWAQDNDRRGLVDDLTRQLGGIHVPNAAIEMTHNWRSYRYMINSAANRAGITKMEDRLRKQPLAMIPKASLPAVEAKIQNGDIISIVAKDPPAYGTAHVGIALRKGGVVRFMHACSLKNCRQVLIDDRLSDYLDNHPSDVGIMVTRPVK